MRYNSFFFLLLLIVVSCTTKARDQFTITGKISNNKAKWAYLEKVPATMQPSVEDSVLIGKDGSFTLHTAKGESVVYNVRLDQQRYPVASVISDNDQVRLDITMSPGNSEFAEKYTVTGSAASQQMKSYMETVNRELQKIFVISHQRDSLQRSGASDSLLLTLAGENEKLAANIKALTIRSLNEAKEPSLVLYELGYYQGLANAGGFGVEGLPTEKVMEIIDNTAKAYPAHKGVAAVKAQLAESAAQAEQTEAPAWVGKPAPGFTLPDVNGKPVSLASFKGKYVLVDFWASWCGPCRQENPNVVNVYNQFKDKGFTVLGVSLDRPGQKDNWLQAIEKDKLTWTHVSDLQYWNSPVVELYGFNGIPFNVLVGPDGTVIAQDLRGSNLGNTLSGLLK